MLRTNTCGELTIKEAGKVVTLAGWVHRRRDHGGIIFIDLRDRYGLTQVKFDPKINKKTHAKAEALRGEWVIRATGKVALRPDDMINKKMPTGEIEVEVDHLEIYSKAKTPPFELDENKLTGVKEELRMKYRYIDMRREKVREIIKKRHQFIGFIRSYLNKENFFEIETPMLTKSTPEGARDFLVPSRLQPGQFYALPQSPQQYKQMLMVAGMDKYYQIVKCFRDEDTRGDRQAEFTQLDIEMSFVEQDDILSLTENMFTQAIEKFFPDMKIMKKPWPRLDYDEVMLKYGSDKPDLRFGMEIQDISELVKNSEFKVFSDTIKSGGYVRAICATGAAKFTRREIDELTEFVKTRGAKGLAYIIVKENGETQSPIVKFLGEKIVKEIIKKTGAKAGDIIFFGADKKSAVCEALGALRLELGRRLELIDPALLGLAYIVNFPLFEEGMENGHYAPSHHMFTAPKTEDIKLLDKDPSQVRSYQHDLVCNGYEIGGGSIRIHDVKLQEKIFDLIGFDEARKKKFDHFLRAFRFGVPPHGGIAPGLDRVLMVLMNQPSIRDVMAFPKTSDGRDLVMEAPSRASEEQLKELSIRVVKK